jgi:hypothetical protein
MALKKNEKIAIGIVGGVILYLLFKKPKFVILEKEKQSGGGGIVGGFMPILTTATSTPVATTTTTTTPKTEPKPTEIFPTCKTGERYNPVTKKCEPIPLDKPSDSSVKDVVTGGGGSVSGGGGVVVTPYDPCKDNGYGGTYDPATNTCKLSPYCGGGTLKLDSNGKAVGCEAKVPTGGEVLIGGVVGFSGNLPLTLDNLLM